jgi:hypothetical protein
VKNAAGEVTAYGKIDVADAVKVGSDFGTSQTGSTDIHGDGTVTIYNLVHVGRNYIAVAGPCS